MLAGSGASQDSFRYTFQLDAMSDSRFTSQASTAEDRLKTQTVGLSTFADFRKFHADALEQSEKDALDSGRNRTPPNGAPGEVASSAR